jgi:hypothetical protein
MRIQKYLIRIERTHSKHTSATAYLPVHNTPLSLSLFPPSNPPTYKKFDTLTPSFSIILPRSASAYLSKLHRTVPAQQTRQ